MLNGENIMETPPHLGKNWIRVQEIEDFTRPPTRMNPTPCKEL